MQERWTRRVVILVATLTVVRLVIAASTGLSDTEAYYVGWARWPGLSYYDHPPLVAWTTWLVSKLVLAGGTTAPIVRLVPIACSAAFALLVHRFTTRLFSPRAGFFAAVLVSAMPAFMMTSLLVNPEGLLAPLWVLALEAIWDLRDRNEPWRPLWLAALVGVGFLAKYTALLLVPLALAWVLVEPTARRWLARPTFWASGLVALAIASPVVVWNASRGFPSARLHLVERVATPSMATWATNAEHVLASQLALFHPLVFPALIFAGVLMAAARAKDVRHRFLLVMGAPTLAFFLLMMVRVSDAEPHWTMVAYVPFATGLAAIVDGALDRLAVRAWIVAVASTSAFALAIYGVHMASPVLLALVPSSAYEPNADPVNETLGWDRIAAAVGADARRLGKDAVVASNHNVLCGHLEVALGDSPSVYCVSTRRTEFDFVGRGRVPSNVPVVYVETDRYPRAPRDALGRACIAEDDVAIARAGHVVQRVHVWSCPANRANAPVQALR